MRICIVIMLLVSTVSSSFAKRSFKEFLLIFTPVRELVDSMFIAPRYPDEVLDMEEFGDYLPVLGNGKDGPKCEVYWYKKGWCTEKDGILAVITFSVSDLRSCDEKSEYDQSKEENTVIDCYLLTYTKEGSLVDAARISRDGDCYFSRVRNFVAHPVSINVEQGVATDGRMFLFYDDVSYKVVRLKYTMSNDGTISSVQEGEPWEELLPQEGSTPQEITFDAFLKLFHKWEKATVDETVFTTRGGMVRLHVCVLVCTRHFGLSLLSTRVEMDALPLYRV